MLDGMNYYFLENGLLKKTSPNTLKRGDIYVYLPNIFFLYYLEDKLHDFCHILITERENIYDLDGNHIGKPLKEYVITRLKSSEVKKFVYKTFMIEYLYKLNKKKKEMEFYLNY